MAKSKDKKSKVKTVWVAVEDYGYEGYGAPLGVYSSEKKARKAHPDTEANKYHRLLEFHEFYLNGEAV